MKRHAEVFTTVFVILLVIGFSHCKKENDNGNCKTCTATANGQVKATQQVCSDAEEQAFRRSQIDANVTCE